MLKHIPAYETYHCPQPLYATNISPDQGAETQGHNILFFTSGARRQESPRGLEESIQGCVECSTGRCPWHGCAIELVQESQQL